MKRTLSAISLLVFAGLASAQLTISGSSLTSFSGYDGQPASVTGTLNSGEHGTLESLTSGTVTFTYLGNESGNTNLFKFSVGSQSLTEASALGSSVSGAISAGALGFSFTDTNTASTFGNGSMAMAYMKNVGTAYGAFQYVIGFNDNGSSDGDFDDFVVGVNVTPAVPEPETYALLLAGLGAVGFVARRRKLQS